MDDLDRTLQALKRWEPPGPEEVRVYSIGRFFLPPITVALKGVPPCLMCGTLVTSPSTDGPLLCGRCACGRNQDGSRWSSEDGDRLHRNMAAAAKYYEQHQGEVVVEAFSGYAPDPGGPKGPPMQNIFDLWPEKK